MGGKRRVDPATGKVWCPGCEVYKDREDFYTQKSAFSGVGPRCKVCRRAQRKQRRENKRIALGLPKPKRGRPMKRYRQLPDGTNQARCTGASGCKRWLPVGAFAKRGDGDQVQMLCTECFTKYRTELRARA